MHRFRRAYPHATLYYALAWLLLIAGIGMCSYAFFHHLEAPLPPARFVIP